MSEVSLDRAKYEYRQFIHALSASKARDVSSHEPDPIVEPVVEVDANEAVDAFLRKKPAFECFRDELRGLRNEGDMYCFIERLWRDL